MLVTLHKDSRSSFVGALDESAIQHEAAPAPPAPRSGGISLELPYTTNAAALLAPALLSWRLARPGRLVILCLRDGSEIEIGAESAARIEWLMPVVEEVHVVEPRQA